MVEGARLERVYTGNRIGGSNPPPSANYAEFYADAQAFALVRLALDRGRQRRGSAVVSIDAPGMMRSVRDARSAFITAARWYHLPG